MKTFKLYFYKTLTINANTDEETQVPDYTSKVYEMTFKAINDEVAHMKAMSYEEILQEKLGFSVMCSFKQG